MRPSGTEEVYKLYAESFLGIEHLTRIQDEGADRQGARARPDGDCGWPLKTADGNLSGVTAADG